MKNNECKTCGEIVTEGTKLDTFCDGHCRAIYDGEEQE